MENIPTEILTWENSEQIVRTHALQNCVTLPLIHHRQIIFNLHCLLKYHKFITLTLLTDTVYTDIQCKKLVRIRFVSTSDKYFLCFKIRYCCCISEILHQRHIIARKYRQLPNHIWRRVGEIIDTPIQSKYLWLPVLCHLGTYISQLNRTQPRSSELSSNLHIPPCCWLKGKCLLVLHVRVVGFPGQVEAR